MIGKLYEKTLYTVPVDFIITPIYEYDISKANISILLQKGVIDVSQYNDFYNMNREDRQINIGYMQRNNPEIIKILEEGFKEARYSFIVSNNIQDDEIVSIKKDSLFITKQANVTKFGHVNFTLRNTYSIMVKIHKLEVYYNINPMSFEHSIDIKGIKNEVLIKHESTYIHLLCEILYLICNNRPEDAIRYMKNFVIDYDNLILPIEFYREFNQQSLYRVSSVNSAYYIDDAIGLNSCNLDISYNRQFNRELMKLITSLFISMRRHP